MVALYFSRSRRATSVWIGSSGGAATVCAGDGAGDAGCCVACAKVRTLARTTGRALVIGEKCTLPGNCGLRTGDCGLIAEGGLTSVDSLAIVDVSIADCPNP